MFWNKNHLRSCSLHNDTEISWKSCYLLINCLKSSRILWKLFITNRQASPSGTRRVYFTFPHSASWRSNNIVHSHLGRSIIRCLFPSGLRLNFCKLFSPFSFLLHDMSISPFCAKFPDHEVCLVNSTNYEAHLQKYSPMPRYLLFLRAKYFSSIRFSKVCYCRSLREQISRLLKRQMKLRFSKVLV
jgi:hypothetical protein